MSDTSETKLKLGLFKQAIMKLDSALTDMYEIREDVDLDETNKETMSKLCEMVGVIEATLRNIVVKEYDEDDFLSESFPMDAIDGWPGDSFMEDEEGENLLDEPV